MEHSTVEELGFTLPIGKEQPDGSRVRDFAFKPWRTSDEKAIGKWRDKNRTASYPQFTAYVLAYFLTRWCGESFADMPIDKRRLVLSTSFASDIFYAWIMLRREALTDDLDVDVSCGTCLTHIPYTLQLGSIEVKTPGDDDALTAPYRLRDGLQWQGKDNRVLTIMPVRWWAYESAKAGAVNMGSLKAQVIAGAIVGLDQVDGEVRLPEEAMDLTKYDLESLSAWINDNQPGPDLAIELACPKCRTTIVKSIPWMYDDFFSIRDSSPSRP